MWHFNKDWYKLHKGNIYNIFFFEYNKYKFFTVTFVAIAWVGKDFGCTQFPIISGVILASSSHL